MSSPTTTPRRDRCAPRSDSEPTRPAITATRDPAPARAGLETLLERLHSSCLCSSAANAAAHLHPPGLLGLALAVAWTLLADRIGPTAPSGRTPRWSKFAARSLPTARPAPRGWYRH